MPTALLTHTVPWVFFSLAACLTNVAREGGTAEQQAAAPSQPQGTDAAVRFDLSARAARTAAAAISPAVSAPEPPAAVAAASGAPAPAAGAAAQTGPGVPGGGTLALRAVETTGVRLPEAAALDDEARTRAWAIRTVARESTLSMIGRLARMSEPVETPRLAEITADCAPKAFEPKTLARV